MKSHGSEEYNFQMNDDISDLSFNPVNVLKKSYSIVRWKTWKRRELAKINVLFGFWKKLLC